METRLRQGMKTKLGRESVDVNGKKVPAGTEIEVVAAPGSHEGGSEAWKVKTKDGRTAFIPGGYTKEGEVDTILEHAQEIASGFKGWAKGLDKAKNALIETGKHALLEAGRVGLTAVSALPVIGTKLIGTLLSKGNWHVPARQEGEETVAEKAGETWADAWQEVARTAGLFAATAGVAGAVGATGPLGIAAAAFAGLQAYRVFDHVVRDRYEKWFRTEDEKAMKSLLPWGMRQFAEEDENAWAARTAKHVTTQFLNDVKKTMANLDEETIRKALEEPVEEWARKDEMTRAAVERFGGKVEDAPAKEEKNVEGNVKTKIAVFEKTLEELKGLAKRVDMAEEQPGAGAAVRRWAKSDEWVMIDGIPQPVWLLTEGAGERQHYTDLWSQIGSGLHALARLFDGDAAVAIDSAMEAFRAKDLEAIRRGVDAAKERAGAAGARALRSLRALDRDLRRAAEVEFVWDQVPGGGAGLARLMRTETGRPTHYTLLQRLKAVTRVPIRVLDFVLGTMALPGAALFGISGSEFGTIARDLGGTLDGLWDDLTRALGREPTPEEFRAKAAGPISSSMQDAGVGGMFTERSRPTHYGPFSNMIENPGDLRAILAHFGKSKDDPFAKQGRTHREIAAYLGITEEALRDAIVKIVGIYTEKPTRYISGNLESRVLAALRHFGGDAEMDEILPHLGFDAHDMRAWENVNRCLLRLENRGVVVMHDSDSWVLADVLKQRMTEKKTHADYGWSSSDTREYKKWVKTEATAGDLKRLIKKAGKAFIKEDLASLRRVATQPSNVPSIAHEFRKQKRDSKGRFASEGRYTTSPPSHYAASPSDVRNLLLGQKVTISVQGRSGRSGKIVVERTPTGWSVGTVPGLGKSHFLSVERTLDHVNRLVGDPDFTERGQPARYISGNLANRLSIIAGKLQVPNRTIPGVITPILMAIRGVMRVPNLETMTLMERLSDLRSAVDESERKAEAIEDATQRDMAMAWMRTVRQDLVEAEVYTEEKKPTRYSLASEIEDRLFGMGVGAVRRFGNVKVFRPDRGTWLVAASGFAREFSLPKFAARWIALLLEDQAPYTEKKPNPEGKIDD